MSVHKYQLFKNAKLNKWFFIIQFLFSIISAGAIIFMTFGMNYIMKEIENENFRIVSIICSTIIFGYILNSILNYFQYLVNVKMSQKIGLKMRNNLLKKINLLPIDFFDKYSSGDILSRFTVDLNNIINFISEYLVDYIGVIV